jgi:hypothetical protein
VLVGMLREGRQGSSRLPGARAAGRAGPSGWNPYSGGGGGKTGVTRVGRPIHAPMRTSRTPSAMATVIAPCVTNFGAPIAMNAKPTYTSTLRRRRRRTELSGLGSRLCMHPLSAAAGISWRSAIGELLTDCEEDRTLRAVLVGMLREGDRNAYGVIGRDGRGVASTEKASYVPVEPHPLGFVCLRSET